MTFVHGMLVSQKLRKIVKSILVYNSIGRVRHMKTYGLEIFGQVQLKLECLFTFSSKLLRGCKL